jgi:hypothetical protein
MSFVFHAPFNSVSFGQVSTAILRELFRRGVDCKISPLKGSANFQSQNLPEDFVEWFKDRVDAFHKTHDRKDPCLNLWHFQDSIHSPSEKQFLFTFYELDDPTEIELNTAKNMEKVIFSSKYAVDLFTSHGVDAVHVPLGFDHHNFNTTEKSYFDDDRIVFNLGGKFEHRKHHAKILKAWTKRFGNDPKVHLQCAIFNPFLSAEDNNALIKSALDGNKFFNVVFLNNMKTNAEYNDYLNSANIIIGMSGGEGWGLPEFQSVSLGKHAVLLNAHAYKDWADRSNSVMVDSLSKIECYDGIFFKKGMPYNQGKIFDWNEDDFIHGCEEAIKRVKSNPVNEEGQKLKDKFSYEKTVDALLELL